MEDIALALGIKMVASRNFDGYYLAERLAEAGVEPMEIDEASNTINFEQVLSYNPDLIIIRDNFEQSVVDELSKIAPTIAFNLKDTEATLMGLGMALNKEEDATNRLKQYYEKWDSTREALQSKLGTQKVALVRIMQKEIRLMPYSKNDNSSFLYDPNYLGLVAPQLVKDYDNQESLAISLEKLPELDADQILLIAGYGSADTKMVEAAKTRYKEISSDPLWNTIPAVNAGNIHEVDSRIWLAYGIISNEIKMDDLLKIYGN
jgi:putative iron(III) dicitrate-binding periplasmic protein